MDKTVHQFAKNATEEVRVSLTEFKGHKLIDLRIYYEPEDGGDRKPTNKGITIDVSLYPELKRALLRVEKELLKDKLVEEEILEEIQGECSSSAK